MFLQTLISSASVIGWTLRCSLMGMLMAPTGSSWSGNRKATMLTAPTGSRWCGNREATILSSSSGRTKALICCTSNLLLPPDTAHPTDIHWPCFSVPSMSNACYSVWLFTDPLLLRGALVHGFSSLPISNMLYLSLCAIAMAEQLGNLVSGFMICEAVSVRMYACSLSRHAFS